MFPHEATERKLAQTRSALGGRDPRVVSTPATSKHSLHTVRRVGCCTNTRRTPTQGIIAKIKKAAEVTVEEGESNAPPIFYIHGE